MVAISYFSLGLAAISTAVATAPSAIDIDNKFFSHIHAHGKRSLGHSHVPHSHGHNHTKRSTTCSFPTGDGLVAVSPGSTNAGWALSPDTACTAGSWCPYACPSGQLMAQWDPAATSYTYPQSQYGGLYCGDDGQASKPFPNKPYCNDGTGTVSAISSAGSIAFCQTVLPGNEAMLIPTEVTSGSTTLAVPDPSYWAGTAAHYYINPPGVSTNDGCVWGSTANPWGNWSPYVAGANTDSSGTTYVKVGWNPVYLQDDSPYKNTLPSWGINITCPDGGCSGLPCGIDPSVHGMNQCYNQAPGAGGGNFCVIGVQSGSSATIEVFNSGSSSSNAKAAAAVNLASSSSASLEESSSMVASTPTSDLVASSTSPASTTSTWTLISSALSNSSSSSPSPPVASSTSLASSSSSDTSSSSSAAPVMSAGAPSVDPTTSTFEVLPTADTSLQDLPTSTEEPLSSATSVQLFSTEATVDSSSTENPVPSTSISAQAQSTISSTSISAQAQSTISFSTSSSDGPATTASAIASPSSETVIGEPTTSSDSVSYTTVTVVSSSVDPSSTISSNYSSTAIYASNSTTDAAWPSSSSTLTSLSSSIQPTDGSTWLMSTPTSAPTTTTGTTSSSSTFDGVSTISSMSSRGAQYLNLEQSSTTLSTSTSSSTGASTSNGSSSSSNNSYGNVSAGVTLRIPGTVYMAALAVGAVLIFV
ncbi:hypothetical protein V1525DRAFT_400567 [Lipomyces kononenkoae]|uniref:Uncharacterized protein n=1 Tax=Lipomyces kononenkoae TaxID=34357 RepID=A0ACC3T4I0_LIPKO